MTFYKSKVKRLFDIIDEVVLKIWNTALNFTKRCHSNKDLDNLNQGIAEIEVKPSFCSLYTSNYDGTTCLQQYLCAESNGLCHKCIPPTEFVKSLFGCFINLMCYPFIPCFIAFLPSSFHIAGYTNTNSLYPCYGKTCCFCIKDNETSFSKFCCSPVFLLVWISLLLVAGSLLLWNYISQDSMYIIQLLLYFENLDEFTALLLFIALFTVVSFPMMWGYVVLNLAAGYMYGFWLGVSVVIVSVTFGLTVAHIICKKYFAKCVMNLLKKRSNYNQIEAILQVIDGSSGLKVVSLTRLTPIPFGFQNGLFSVSNINLKYYLLASNIGLLPTQVLNCYVASKFRSMEQIVEEDATKHYAFFILQIAISVALMVFVVQRARKELAAALQNHNSLDVLKPEESSRRSNETSDTLQNIRVTQPEFSTIDAPKQVVAPVVDV